MATIGSVLISVYAKTDGLRKSLKKAEKTIGKFASSAAKKLKGLSVAIGVGVVAGITAIIATVNKYASEIDRLAKTSSKLGITTKTLQKLQYQAELTGLGAEKFNKAFNKMTTVIADANNGLSTAVRAFDKLGLDIEYINSLSADQQFYAIAEAMKGINNQTEKLGLAKDIFGAGATGILNTLNSDLRQTSAEFESLGISVTQSGAAMVEAYQDSKTKLSAIFSGFGLKLTESLAGPFKILVDWITKIVKEMGGLEVFAKKVATAFIQGIGLIIKGGAEIFKFINKIKIVIAELSGAWLKVTNIISKVKLDFEKSKKIEMEIKVNDAELKALRENYINLNKSIDQDIDNKIKKLTDAIGGSSQSIAQKSSPAQDGILIAQQHSKALSKAANDAVIMAESTKIAASSVDNFANSIGLATKSVSPYSATDKPGAYSFSSSLSGAKGLNPGLSALSASKSATSAINATPSLGEFNINMQTDAGKISGKLFGEPSFITSLKTFSDKNTNESARMAAQ